MANTYGSNKRNPFGGGDEPSPSLNEIDAAIYGEVALPDSGRVVAKPVEIDQVRPDLTQPRRAIPLQIRGAWSGSVDDLPALLRHWQDQVEGLAGQRVSVKDVILGRAEMRRDDETPSPVVDDYYDLLSLAASIYRDGLANPITVTRSGVIETGERRWLAHWLIALETQDKKWWRVPAIRIERSDVWRQAAENGARKPLNAISIARQLALLLMDMYEGTDGVRFDTYETLILPGESDRRFYAQVANGNTYPIKRGMGQRVLDVTGLKSGKQLRDYRALLTLPDSMWMQADLESWTEGRIRMELDNFRGTNRAGAVAQNTPSVSYSAPVGALSPQNEPEMPYRTAIGERMGLYSGGDVSPLMQVQNEPETAYGERNWLTDDTWTEEDQREYVEIEAQRRAWDEARNRAMESTDPIITDEQMLAVLKALHLLGKSTGNVPVEKRAKEFAGLSLEDARKAAALGGNSLDVWRNYLLDTATRMKNALAVSGERVDLIAAQLIRASEEMAEKYGRHE